MGIIYSRSIKTPPKKRSSKKYDKKLVRQPYLIYNSSCGLFCIGYTEDVYITTPEKKRLCKPLVMLYNGILWFHLEHNGLYLFGAQLTSDGEFINVCAIAGGTGWKFEDKEIKMISFLQKTRHKNKESYEQIAYNNCMKLGTRRVQMHNIPWLRSS